MRFGCAVLDIRRAVLEALLGTRQFPTQICGVVEPGNEAPRNRTSVYCSSSASFQYCVQHAPVRVVFKNQCVSARFGINNEVTCGVERQRLGFVYEDRLDCIVEADASRSTRIPCVTAGNVIRNDRGTLLADEFDQFDISPKRRNLVG